ncbi:MAG TPA: VF_A0006 family four-cysteine protein [Pseudolabrys sp.]|jgi:hypothetical protein
MVTLLDYITVAPARGALVSSPTARRIGQSLRILAVIGVTIVPVAGRAQFDANKAQAECELSAIRDTRSPLAVTWIRTACNRLAIDTGPLHESNRRFHLCLVQSLSGAQSDAAANQIISACRTSNPP